MIDITKEQLIPVREVPAYLESRGALRLAGLGDGYGVDEGVRHGGM